MSLFLGQRGSLGAVVRCARRLDVATRRMAELADTTPSAVVERITSRKRTQKPPSHALKASLLEVSHAKLTVKQNDSGLQVLNPEDKQVSTELFGTRVPEALPAGGLKPLNSVQRRRALAFHGATVAARKAELLEMHPDRLAVQQDILRARSVGRVLAICSEEELQRMDLVNLITAVHRIAKLYEGSHSALAGNPRFEKLLTIVSEQIDVLQPRGIVHLVWSLASLQCWPNWANDLMFQRCKENCSSFTGRDLSVLLGSLVKVTKLAPLRECKQLQEVLVGQLHQRLPELTTSVDLACAAAALSRLQVRDERLFVAMAQQAHPILEEFSMSDITSLLWAFAALNFTHSELCEGIRSLLRQQAETCSPKELTQIAWALSRLQEADEELLTETIAPVVRSKFLDFEVPRDLCTLAFAFSNVRVFDAGIFNDFAHTLTSKVRLMNAHDVSSIVAAFAGIEYAHKALFKALTKHTKAIMPTFTPLQLARTIHGFGTAGVEDPSLYKGLFRQTLKQRQLLHASNIVEILIGLAEAEYVPEGMGEFLRDAPQLLKFLDAAECIHALHALSRLNVDANELILELLKTTRSRAQGWWRFQLHEMADLVEAMVTLKLDDALLLNICAGQLPRLLSKSLDSAAFLRLWGALAELPPNVRETVQERLHKSQRLRDAVSSCLCTAVEGIQAVSHSDNLAAARAASQLLCASTSLSWDAVPIPELISLTEKMLKHDMLWQEGPGQHWWPLLAWALAELGHEDLARPLVRSCLQNLVALDEEGKQRVAAAVVCLGFHEDFIGARAILNEERRNDIDTPDVHSQMWVEWLEVEIALMGPALPHCEVRPAGKGSLHDHADDISNALIELSVAHEAQVFISVHRAQALLPGQVALLVQSPRDLTISDRQLGSARARSRQLTALGWTCKELHFKEVEKALAFGDLKDLLTSVLPSAKWAQCSGPRF